MSSLATLGSTSPQDKTEVKARKSLPQPWHQAFQQPAQEFGPVNLQVISGQIPQALQGTFFQNGTGRLERGGKSVGHWFDGDGAILRVGFANGQANGSYRYVQTKGYTEESKAGRYLYSNYGQRYPGPVWRHIKGLFNGTSVKNSANTSVLALSDKLLALWEAGNPHALDLQTLETEGIEDLGWLKEAQPFSAHPLTDPISGEIYSIGVTPLCNLNLYRCDAQCRLLKQNKIWLKNISLVHSFVIAGSYLVFLVSPVVTNVLPLLLNRQAFVDAAEWKEDRGTRLIVVDRESLAVVTDTHIDPWFQWHFGNGCEEADGTLRLDFARFDEFSAINQVLREVPSGRISTQAYGRLWQLRINPKTGKVISNDCVLDRDCEFPQVPKQQVGQPWRYTYVMMHRDGVSTGEDWFGAVGRFDYDTGELIQADLGDGHYASEPLHVTDKTAEEAETGWVLTVVYSAIKQRSELWIFDALRLGEPVCRLALPTTVPIGFHGTWQPA